jgi:hypothetical protein
MFMVKPVIYKIYLHLKKSTGYHHLPMLRPKQERPHQLTGLTDNFWNVSGFAALPPIGGAGHRYGLLVTFK